MSLTAGTEFAGYTIVRKIGAGGMGEVYLADHPRLPRQDVIKVLSEHFTDDATFRARFIREAELAAGLDHPSIVNVYDRGESDGRLWIAMQYVPGIDAAALLERSPNGLPVTDVSAIAASIGAALDYAHRHGLLHRDVKPANILISGHFAGADAADLRIRLADFGIARQADAGTSLTSANLVIGSFPYSSPEQLSGEPLDGRSDVYSLGCTVYELLTGTPPFVARSPAVLIHHHLNEIPASLSARRGDLPRAVDDAVQRALAKQTAERPDTASEFAAELQLACAVRPTVAASTPGSTVQTLRIRAGAPHTQRSPTPPPRPRPRPAPTEPATTPVPGFPAQSQAYSALPNYDVTMRASADFPAPTFDETRVRDHDAARSRQQSATPKRHSATGTLVCGLLAIPLSVVAGIGVGVGALGLYLGGRPSRPSAVAKVAQTLNLLAIILGIGFVAFAIGYAWMNP